MTQDASTLNALGEAPRNAGVQPVASDHKPLTTTEKVIVGGLGGMTPIVATLMAGEHDLLPALFDSDSYKFYLGLGLRGLLFFLVGAVFVWLHNDVLTRYAVFRLGVTAPALIAAMIGAGPAGADVSGQTSSLSLEPQVASLASQRLSDADAPTIVWQDKKKCSVLDGLVGRKCK